MKFLKFFFVVIGIIMFVGYLAGDEEQRPDNFNTDSVAEKPERVAANCEEGTPVSGTYYVLGNEIDFRLGPSGEHDRVVNDKATKILGKTQHRTLWSTMVLESKCETNDWLEARIVKADGSAVAWETGWVNKKFVSKEASKEMKAGLLWDIDSETTFSDVEKQIVKRGALKVLRDEANCSEIITGYRSGSQKGAYYVTCNAKNGGTVFNVWFTPKQVEDGNRLAVPHAYPEAQSRQVCIEAIKAQLSRPSTLNIHHLLGYATEVHNNGNRTVIQEFSVENGVGIKLDIRARCLFQPSGTFEITFTETQQ